MKNRERWKSLFRFSTGRRPAITLLDESGFSLLELLYTFIIIAILAMLGYPSYNYVLDKAKEARCSEEIRGIERDIQAFTVERGVLPEKMEDINRKGMRDPWGNEYEYVTAEKAGGARRKYVENLNDDFDLYSKGKNGESDPRIDTDNSSDDIIRAGTYVGLASEY